MSDLDSLSAELRVSQSTVRRDIEALVEEGLVRRTHGGVIWVGDRGPNPPPPGTRPYAFDQRLEFQIDAKQQIARAAKSLVQPGETILIDGGTTTFHFAQELAGLNLQIVTNSLPISNLFLNDDNVELIVSGGVLYPRSGVLLRPMTESLLDHIHARKMFFSVAGINAGILYNQNLLLVQAEQRMMRQAQQIILLADSGKFNQQALAKLCELSEIDTVVSDANLPEDQQKMVRDAGCELILA